MSTYRKSTLWLDLINKHYEKTNNHECRLSATHEHYSDGLYTAKVFLKNNPEARDTSKNGRTYYVYKDNRKSFIKFFTRQFSRRIKKKTNASAGNRTTRRRPRGLLDTDIALDEQFYRSNGIDLSLLTEKELGEFMLEKDNVHEELYGNISRFDKANHGYISKEKKKCKLFVKGLQSIASTIVSNRIIPERHYRSHITFQ